MPPDFVKQQITELALEASRPLIICDADEVLVYFIGPLAAFLEENGAHLVLESFRLLGNIRHMETGKPLEKAPALALLDRFFSERVAACPPVEGAVAALEELSERAEIVVLTNVPIHARAARAAALADQGMAYPLIANAGAKGPAVTALSEQCRGPVIFIDDIPQNHASVAAHAARTHRIHFVADPRLRDLIGPAEHCHARIDEWPAAKDYILAYLEKAGN
ncbi:MAG: HAD family hydrolase [Proteobacteria bacterium]|nr:HAD family hydrolase [Pseudomonadota bacterium]